MMNLRLERKKSTNKTCQKSCHSIYWTIHLLNVLICFSSSSCYSAICLILYDKRFGLLQEEVNEEAMNFITAVKTVSDPLSAAVHRVRRRQPGVLSACDWTDWGQTDTISSRWRKRDFLPSLIASVSEFG